MLNVGFLRVSFCNLRFTMLFMFKKLSVSVFTLKIWPKFIVAKIILQGFNDLYKDTLEKTWTDRKDRFGVRQKCKFVTKTFEI